MSIPAADCSRFLPRHRVVNKPLTSAIYDTAHSAIRYAKWGVVISIVACLLPLYGRFPISSKTATAQNPPGAKLQMTTGDVHKLTAVEILRSLGEGPEPPSYGKVRAHLGELEVILGSPVRDPYRIAGPRIKLIDELKEMEKRGNSDPETLSATTYPLILCAVEWRGHGKPRFTPQSN